MRRLLNFYRSTTEVLILYSSANAVVVAQVLWCSDLRMREHVGSERAPACRRASGSAEERGAQLEVEVLCDSREIKNYPCSVKIVE